MRRNAFLLTWIVLATLQSACGGSSIIAGHDADGDLADSDGKPPLCDTRNCSINGICYAEGGDNPENHCLYCSPDASAKAWTARPFGTACGEGAQCDGKGVCAGGDDDPPETESDEPAETADPEPVETPDADQDADHSDGDPEPDGTDHDQEADRTEHDLDADSADGDPEPDGTDQDLDANDAESEAPSPVLAKALAAGSYHSCYLTTEGRVACWGDNSEVQLGIPFAETCGTGKPPYRCATPGFLKGLPTDIVSLHLGMLEGCALTASGSLWCWGNNEWGQLGLGSMERQSSPAAAPWPAGVKDVSVGPLHTCVLAEHLALYCAGLFDTGVFGSVTAPTDAVACEYALTASSCITSPRRIEGLPAGIVSVANGSGFSCVLTNQGAVWCWGVDSANQLGKRSDASSTCTVSGNHYYCHPLPQAVPGLPNDIKAISAGYFHACALTGGSAVWCWGDNESGQLATATATTSDSAVPLAIPGLPADIVALGSASSYTCALSASGAVWCWGDLNDTRFGGRVDKPTRLDTLPADVTAIGVGDAHVCALTKRGSVHCVGENSLLQLGLPTMP